MIFIVQYKKGNRIVQSCSFALHIPTDHHHLYFIQTQFD